MAKVTHKEVIEFFKTADRDLAELTLEIADTAVKTRVATGEKISQNLKKARAARKPKGNTAAPAEAQTTEGDGSSPITEGRARRAAAAGAAGVGSAPAPATIGSTGVESDSEFEAQRG